MPRTFNLAVLECDTPIDPVLNGRGRYGVIIRTLFERGLQQYKLDSNVADEIELKVTWSNMVELDALPNPEEVDALVLSGSSTSRRLPCPMAARPSLLVAL